METQARNHRCTIGTLDYENVVEGFIVCDDCGRIYRLGPNGWVANPPAVETKQTKVRRYRR